MTRLALQYRQKFKKDVVIDLVCYRRHGHNEADEPSATQPIMYGKSRNTGRRATFTPRSSIERHVIEAYRRQMPLCRTTTATASIAANRCPRSSLGMIGNEYTVDWSPFLDGTWDERSTRRSARDVQDEDGRGDHEYSARHEAARARAAHHVDERGRMARGEVEMDWGFAETMAYASLIERWLRVPAGRPGQRSRHVFPSPRGIAQPDQQPRVHAARAPDCRRPERFPVIDSLLSEEAVLGFEYGYATTSPGTLVIWEGQFGDFANGAQVVIDQFISSGEAKWGRLCGLTAVPAARLRGPGARAFIGAPRALPAAVRRAQHAGVRAVDAGRCSTCSAPDDTRTYRKPLIVMTPKSLLRHKMSDVAARRSTVGWKIPADHSRDREHRSAAEVRRVVFCSGKVYYDLLEARQVHGLIDDVRFIMRIEQLYPFPIPEYAAQLEQFARRARLSGARKSRRTRVPGTRFAIGCRNPWAIISSFTTQADPGGSSSGVRYFQDSLVQQQQALVEAALGIESQGKQVGQTQEN